MSILFLLSKIKVNHCWKLCNQMIYTYLCECIWYSDSGGRVDSKFTFECWKDLFCCKLGWLDWVSDSLPSLKIAYFNWIHSWAHSLRRTRVDCCQTPSLVYLVLKTHWSRDEMDTLSKLHFQMYSILNEDAWISLNNSPAFVSNWPNASIGSDNGLAPSKLQAIIWTNVTFLRIHAPHGLNGLIKARLLSQLLGEVYPCFQNC